MIRNAARWSSVDSPDNWSFALRVGGRLADPNAWDDVSVQQSGNTLFQDDFNRASIGANWQTMAGGSPLITITSNRATAPWSGSTTYVDAWGITVPVFPVYAFSPLTIEGVVGQISPTTSTTNLIMGLRKPDASYLCDFGWRNSDGQYRLVTPFGGATYSAGTPTVGTNLKLEIQKAIVRAFVNDVLVMTHTV